MKKIYIYIYNTLKEAHYVLTYILPFVPTHFFAQFTICINEQKCNKLYRAFIYKYM